MALCFSGRGFSSHTAHSATSLGAGEASGSPREFPSVGEQRGRRACERGRRGEGSGRIPNQSVLAPDWPGSRAAERRGTTRAPCTRTPQRIAHYVVPKETRPNGRREKGASSLPVLRHCLWAGCRVRHFPSPVLFSSLFSLSLRARVFLALCCPCPSRGRCVFMPRPHRHTRSNSKAHTPSRMRPRASRCGNMAYALFSSTGPAGLSGIVLLCTPARLAHAPFLCAGAVVLLFPFLAIADGPGDGAGVRAGVWAWAWCAFPIRRVGLLPVFLRGSHLFTFLLFRAVPAAPSGPSARSPLGDGPSARCGRVCTQ